MKGGFVFRLRPRLRLKLFLMIYPAILIPTIIAGMLLYRNAVNSLSLQTSDAQLADISFSIDNIDSALNAAENSCVPIMSDKNIRQISGMDAQMDNYTAYMRYHEAIDYLKVTASQSAIISSYYIYFPEQRGFLTTDGYCFFDVDTAELPMRTEASARWYVNQPAPDSLLGPYFNSKKPAQPTLSLNRFFKNARNELRGYLSINVSIDAISRAFSPHASVPDVHSMILDAEGAPICMQNAGSEADCPDYAELFRQIQAQRQSSGAFMLPDSATFVAYRVSDYTGWYYVRMLPAESVFGEAYSIRRLLIMEFCAVAVCAFLISYLLSRIIYRPVRTLSASMKRVSAGELNTQISDTRSDEYGDMYAAFNQMTQKIHGLLQELQDERYLKKEAQLKCLQAQINPHFLYNTLESILCLSRLGQMAEVSELVLCLSRFFRLTLSNGQDIIPLSSVAELARSYLVIQASRFDHLSYEIRIAGDTADIPVPKFLLQPLIENAVLHGMRGGRLQLEICAERAGGELVIDIRDDGVGISAEKLAELRAALDADSAPDGENFALRNLNHQLRLLYGPEGRLSIDGRTGGGTSVTIRFPVRSTGKKEDKEHVSSSGRG